MCRKLVRQNKILLYSFICYIQINIVQSHLNLGSFNTSIVTNILTPDTIYIMIYINNLNFWIKVSKFCMSLIIVLCTGGCKKKNHWIFPNNYLFSILLLLMNYWTQVWTFSSIDHNFRFYSLYYCLFHSRNNRVKC